MRVRIKHCRTCDKPLDLAGPDYLRVRSSYETEREARYYCNRLCLFETAHYDPEAWNSIRSVSRKGGVKGRAT